jgi:hypothetical protein
MCKFIKFERNDLFIHNAILKPDLQKDIYRALPKYLRMLFHRKKLIIQSI